MSSIHHRLLQIEGEFLDTISADDLESATSFAQRWNDLYLDVQASLRVDALDNETTNLAHSLASKIAIFADSFLSMRKASDNITTALTSDLEIVFDNLEIGPPKTNSNGTDTSLASVSTPITRPDPSLPPYIEPAYKWLLRHLHNPYPKKEVKQKIADETESSIERISEWFVDVRRRMGWTLVLREEFGRKRMDMVDAAHRYFISGTPLPPDINGKFVQIEANAHGMYAAKFVPSALSNKLSAAVKDLTPELQEKAREERWQKLQAQREAAKLGVYPSPVSSGASSPISDPGASTSGHKRSSSDASEFDHSSNKRSRTDDGPTSDAFVLSSPPDSSPSSPTSRKRRLSDAGAPGAKRPRIRASSDPIPVTVTLSGTPDLLADWFSSNRDGDTDLFKPGQLLDIKFFDPADLEFEESPATSESVLQEVTPLPQASEATGMVNLDAHYADLVFDFSSYAADYTDQFLPSSQLFASYDPAVYEPQFEEPFAGGHNYDHNYITQQSVAESFGFQSMPSHDNPVAYSAFPDGKASSNLINGLFEQHHRGGNEHATYQPTPFVTS
ncbi:C-terminal domain of homeodomain 1-domain-containing protein [Mycena galericulata]|nr:C-terminal domain of homeodomain 1-domain-containing protein [Mycena galericulata]